MKVEKKHPDLRKRGENENENREIGHTFKSGKIFLKKGIDI